ncbi:hypothetical protein MCAG_00777 [Micromonospora sp. ATCC 39149]|uniref:DUF3618 domain-containing protein n=1 Tax=Micromonospora carbonacea TaxID=47853 RepID=A0A7D5Y576_9ACTN|nr:DUF3618 domain-containing protein [Micromonospora sp. ATCC 39149]EEP70450.1 hypothetical protein MCAG_00777 [Micromonospora sp. ATCC 39149]QLJ96852.1 DUF3618 domain-containing protein [Micromonospora carbonacea]
MTADPDDIRSDIERTRARLSGDVNLLTDKVNPRRVADRKMHEARGRLSALKDRIMGSAAHAGETGRAKTSSAAHQVAAAGSQAKETVGTLPQKQREATQGNPLAAGLIAFGLGALISSLLPPSEPERRAAGQAKGKVTEHSEEIRQQMRTTAHQMQDNLRQPVQEAAGAVKDQAAKSASTMREQGQATAGELRGQAEQTKENIRRQ